jgi:hypothetical protein
MLPIPFLTLVTNKSIKTSDSVTGGQIPPTNASSTKVFANDSRSKTYRRRRVFRPEEKTTAPPEHSSFLLLQGFQASSLPRKRHSRFKELSSSFTSLHPPPTLFGTREHANQT